MGGGEFEKLMNQERFILEVTEAFCEHMKQNKITRTELAKRLGKSRGFVSQVLNGGRNLTIRTIADIAAALGVSPFFDLKKPTGETNKVAWYTQPTYWANCRLPSNAVSERSEKGPFPLEIKAACSGGCRG